MKTTATLRPPTTASTPPTARTAKLAVGGLSLSTLLSSLGTSIANVGLPTLAEAFGASLHAVQWVVVAYLLALTSLIVSVGRLGDLYGRRRMLLAGILFFSVTSVLCGFAPTLGLLIAARAVQGLGAAAMMALAMGFVVEVVPNAQTGRAMGLLGTMSAMGTALGPSLGGWLIAASGWQAIFLLNVPLGFAAFFLVRRYVPNDRASEPETRAGFDAAGTVLLASALTAYALAATIGHGHFNGFNASLLLGAAVAAGLFVLAESKSPAPLVRLAALRDRTLRGGLIASGLVSTVMMTTLVVGPFYLSLSLGLSPALVGMVLSLGPVVAALTGVPAGRMADRLGANRVTVIGLGGIAAGSILLSLLPASLGLVGYVAPIVVITVSYALFQTANNTAMMRIISAEQRGVVSGMLNLSRNLGLITGASVMGGIFAFAAKTADITTAAPAAVAGGLRVTFAFAAALIGIALVMTARDLHGGRPLFVDSSESGSSGSRPLGRDRGSNVAAV